MTNDTKIDKVAFNVGLLWITVLIVVIAWVVSMFIMKSEIDTLRGQVLVVAEAANKQTEINRKLLEVIELQQNELNELSPQ